MVQLNCYWNRDERYYKAGGWKGTKDLDGGTLFTQFSHFIDIMYWLFGDIQNIQGKFSDFNHQEYTDFEDSGFVSFDFINGGMGSLNYSTSVANQNLESSMTIIGQNGSVKIGGQLVRPGDVVVADGDGVLFVPIEFAVEVAKYARQEFVNDKKGRRGIYERMGRALEPSVL